MAMLLHLFMLYQLLPCGNFACMRKLLFNTETENQSKEVFMGEETANAFLGRRLLANRFDFEMFTPGNLERECFEEVCNYEEAREFFENVPKTVSEEEFVSVQHLNGSSGHITSHPNVYVTLQDTFWKQYTQGKDNRPSRLDVTALLVGLIAAGVSLVITGFLVWYFCQRRCKDGFSHSGSVRVRPRRSNASLIMRRLEEVSLQPVLPAPPPLEEINPPGLPSYEDAIVNTGPHDAPPPPYPGSRPGSIQR
uniref:Gla domain-containing protein n=1 Tax=Esox lucius TaxID=8010 RepID=A0A3P9AM71_ESOLU